MPEGHTLHRAARLQTKALGTGPVRMWSPQGRFDEGARVLDGASIRSIEAVGKHLFYHLDRRPILHVHLGLFGKFSTFKEEPYPSPSPNARLAMVGASAVYLSGPTVCELLDAAQADRVIDRLGPDPLAKSPDPERFYAALDRRTVPIAAALLDQAAIAGIGNVYRSELLFLAGIHPDRPANETTREERKDIWTRSVELLTVGERLGRIVTVHPREAGVGSYAKVPKPARLYAYHRTFQPCRRCGTEITSWTVGDRGVWACLNCQPR